MSEYASDGERIYHLWDQYARERDVDGLVSLYAPEAILESPVVCAIFDAESGVLQGHPELRQFFEEGGRRRPNEWVRWYRQPDRFLYDGQRLMWEYPRQAPDGNQIEIMEIMDLANGLIQHHRIYWGWFGIQQLAPSSSKHGEAAREVPA